MFNDIDAMVDVIDSQIDFLAARLPEAQDADTAELAFKLRRVTRQYNELLAKYGVRS